MHCQVCETESRTNSVYCEFCGYALAGSGAAANEGRAEEWERSGLDRKADGCFGCGAEVETGRSFCAGCEVELSADGTVEVEAAQIPDFNQVVDPLEEYPVAFADQPAHEWVNGMTTLEKDELRKAKDAIWANYLAGLECLTPTASPEQTERFVQSAALTKEHHIPPISIRKNREQPNGGHRGRRWVVTGLLVALFAGGPLMQFGRLYSATRQENPVSQMDQPTSISPPASVAIPKSEHRPIPKAARVPITRHLPTSAKPSARDQVARVPARKGNHQRQSFRTAVADEPEDDQRFRVQPKSAPAGNRVARFFKGVGKKVADVVQ